MTKVYSRNEEDYYDDLCEVLDALECDGYLELGAVIYEADKVEYTAGGLFSHRGVESIIEAIQDAAWEEADEFSEGFADSIPKEKLTELESLISDWLTANVPCNFWTVRNVREVEVDEAMLADYRGTGDAAGVGARDCKAAGLKCTSPDCLCPVIDGVTGGCDAQK